MAGNLQHMDDPYKAAKRGPVRVNTDRLNQALDLIEEAKAIVDSLDGPTANHLHMAKVTLEEAMAIQTRITCRNEWNAKKEQD